MDDTRPLPAQPAQGQPRQPGGKRLGPPSRWRRWLKRAAIAAAALLVLLIAGLSVIWVATPSASDAVALAQAQAREHGIAFPGPAVPANFARPLIATEDHRYYGEPGVDLLAVGRVVQARLSGGTDQGGATIEQQLAKMLYTPDQPSGFGAELKQVALAVKLNLRYSKAEILDLYAEVAYYGHGYYGLEAASCGYFGHPASELTVVQGAMLAGVVNAPSVDDPINDPANARARLEHVIARMVAVGDLTAAQGRQVLGTPLGLTAGGSGSC